MYQILQLSHKKMIFGDFPWKKKLRLESVLLIPFLQRFNSRPMLGKTFPVYLTD